MRFGRSPSRVSVWWSLNPTHSILPGFWPNRACGSCGETTSMLDHGTRAGSASLSAAVVLERRRVFPSRLYELGTSSPSATVAGRTRHTSTAGPRPDAAPSAALRIRASRRGPPGRRRHVVRQCRQHRLPYSSRTSRLPLVGGVPFGFAAHATRAVSAGTAKPEPRLIDIPQSQHRHVLNPSSDALHTDQAAEITNSTPNLCQNQIPMTVETVPDHPRARRPDPLRTLAVASNPPSSPSTSA
jgi:hypothetical protein